VDDESQIRLSGEGEAGVRGGTAGNLYVVLHVREHKLFKRQGDDIIYELPVNFAQAALGDEMAVPTVDGEVSLRFPGGTQTGTIFHAEGEGRAPSPTQWQGRPPRYRQGGNAGEPQRRAKEAFPAAL